MATGVADAVRSECEGLGERVTDVWRRATQISQDAGALTAAARDVLDGGVKAATETVASVRRRARDLKHMPGEAASQVRRAPLRAVGGALAVGLLVGLSVGWCANRLRLHGGPRLGHDS